MTQKIKRKFNGLKLQEMRINAGMNLADLSKRLDCHESAVSMWENGERTPQPRWLKKISLFFKVPVSALFLSLLLMTTAKAEMVNLDQYADKIYRIEGGSHTLYPYGIRSIKTKNPRQVCKNTVRNNYRRWIAAGKPGRFNDFLADRYCPASADPIGNRNWKKNIDR